MDIRQEELGDLVDKEMAATSAAIEEAVRRIDVSALYLWRRFKGDKIQQVRIKKKSLVTWCVCFCF